MPVLAKAREQANRIKCAANLHSLGHALVQYTTQFGYYPACSLHTPYAQCALWPVRLRMFLGGNTDAFYCPSRDARFEWKQSNFPPGAIRSSAWEQAFGYEPGEYLLDHILVSFSYGYNFDGTGSPGNYGSLIAGTHKGLGYQVDLRGMGEPGYGVLRASRVKVPSEMIAIADSNANGHADIAIHPTGVRESNLWPGDVHNHGANVLFCDGHVQWYLQKDLILESTTDSWKDSFRRSLVARMWNNDHGG
jgi:prepilin-type processing-associated H-X9-DG protein